MQGINYILIDKDKRILLQKRDKKKGIRCPGELAIPGGSVEKGETSEQAVVREIKEETGLNIATFYIEKLCKHTYSWGQKATIYLVKCGIDIKVDSNEGKMKWIAIEKAKRLKLADNQNKILCLKF